MMILPSILAANWNNLGAEITMCETAGITHLHFDVMDGNFVPTLTFGPKFINDIRQKTDLFFDVHLMVKNPQHYIQDMADAGANMFTFHIEAEKYTFRTIQAVRKSGMKVGIALNPQTSVTSVQSVLREVDTVLIMTVEPGFGGQNFIDTMYGKLQALAQLKQEEHYTFTISVDGGISDKNIKKLHTLGANYFVMGSAFFSQSDKKMYIEEIQKIVRNKN